MPFYFLNHLHIYYLFLNPTQIFINSLDESTVGSMALRDPKGTVF